MTKNDLRMIGAGGPPPVAPVGALHRVEVRHGVWTLILFMVMAWGGLIHAADTNTLSATPAPAIRVTEAEQPGDFPLCRNAQAAEIRVDACDFPVAQLAADLFAGDVRRVVDAKARVVHIHDKIPDNPADFVVVIGTVGKSPSLVDRLVRENKLDVSAIRGKWESFIIKTVENPFPGVKRALVMAGSDGRGTAYAVFTLSEAMGVSPWYWWADVVPAKRSALFIEPVSLIQGPPSVKYRGIFINDEWCLRQWATRTLENGKKHIGPKTYAKVFELLLRLKANYLWPAMHAPEFFNRDPENKVVADQYGIVMGSSHCEQMLYNNFAEWDEKRDGPWNYFTNKERIHGAWERILRENGRFENSYTLGMRGISDRGMQGGRDIHDQIAMMERIFSDQRDLIARYSNPDMAAVSQIFVPYREVMPLYRAGLKVPEDITLVWPDDNYGYMRQLPTPGEQERPGGSGVYYHLGFSHYNMWLSLFPPSQIAYELQKAYQYGADRLWVINVGDIKPAEKEITFALQMAWDIKRWMPENADQFVGEWAATTFGAEFAPEIARIMRDWYRLAARGNPDVVSMGMGGVFNPGEADERLAAFQRIGKEAEALESRLPPRLRVAYLHLVLYQVKALGLFEEQSGCAWKSLSLAGLGDPQALALARRSKEAVDQLLKLNERYNNSAGGKWKGMMGGPSGGFHYLSWIRQAMDELFAKGSQTQGVPPVRESLLEPLARIQARDFSRKSDGGAARIATCPGFGFADGVTVLPTTLQPVEAKQFKDAPWVEYDLDLPQGSLTLQIRTLPTQRIHAGRSLRYAVSTDGKEPVFLDVQADEGYNAWWQNVHRGYSHREVDYPAAAPRQTRLRIYLLEPGVVLQDILVHPAWKRSLPAESLDASNVDDDLSWDAALEAKREAHTLEGLYCQHRLNPAMFHWPVKVDPNHANRLVCTVWGGDKGVITLAIDGVQVARKQLPGNKPGHFIDQEFAIPESLTKGKETVEVQVKSGGIFNAVFACRTESLTQGKK